MTDERDPEQAKKEIGEEIAAGEEPSEEEQEFLERERVDLRGEDGDTTAERPL